MNRYLILLFAVTLIIGCQKPDDEIDHSIPGVPFFSQERPDAEQKVQPSSSKGNSDLAKESQVKFVDAFANAAFAITNDENATYAYFDFVRQDNLDVKKPTGQPFRFKITRESKQISGSHTHSYFSLYVLDDHAFKHLADYNVHGAIEGFKNLSEAIAIVYEVANIKESSLLVNIKTEIGPSIKELILDRKTFQLNGNTFAYDVHHPNGGIWNTTLWNGTKVRIANYGSTYSVGTLSADIWNGPYVHHSAYANVDKLIEGLKGLTNLSY